MEGEISSFREVFSSTAAIKVLDFLIECRSFDYSLTDIAKNANVGWSTIHGFWNDLVKWGIVKKTRRIGRADLYMLNKESKIVQKLLELNKAIANQLLDEELKNQGYDQEKLRNTHLPKHTKKEENRTVFRVITHA